MHHTDQLEELAELLWLASSYIEYVKARNPALHEEANGVRFRLVEGNLQVTGSTDQLIEQASNRLTEHTFLTD